MPRGKTMRERALWRRCDQVPLSERQIKSILYMYSNGYPMSAIMERFHIADHQINKIVKDAGIKPRGILKVWK